MNGFPVHVHFISNHLDLIFDRIEQVLFPMLCCHLSVLLRVVRCAAHLQQVFRLQKTFCVSGRLVFWTLHHLQRPAEVYMCFGGIVADFNTKKIYRYAMFHAFISTTGFTNASLHVKHLLHTVALQSHATASRDGGRTNVKGCLC